MEEKKNDFSMEEDTEKEGKYKGAHIAYVRVSTVEQNAERQRRELKKYGINKWFEEKVSAKDMNRPELQRMLEHIREGDTVYIKDFSRLARSTADLLKLVELFEEKGVKLVSDKENLDTSTSTGKLMLTMLAAINEFERANLLERQREGIAIAKEKGKYKGRQEITRKKLENWDALYFRFENDRKFSKSAMARMLGISRNTLERLLNQEEEERKAEAERTAHQTSAETADQTAPAKPKRKRTAKKKSEQTVPAVQSEVDEVPDEGQLSLFGEG